MKNEDAKDKLANEVIKDFVWRRRWRLVTWIGVSIFAMFLLKKYKIYRAEFLKSCLLLQR